MTCSFFLSLIKKSQNTFIIVVRTHLEIITEKVIWFICNADEVYSLALLQHFCLHTIVNVTVEKP